MEYRFLTPVIRLWYCCPRTSPDASELEADHTHPAFVSRSTTLGHLVPIAGGGDPVADLPLASGRSFGDTADVLAREQPLSVVGSDHPARRRPVPARAVDRRDRRGERVGQDDAGQAAVSVLPGHRGHHRVDGTDLVRFPFEDCRQRVSAGFQNFVRFEL